MRSNRKKKKDKKRRRKRRRKKNKKKKKNVLRVTKEIGSGVRGGGNLSS
jgi:hypothetical protein